MAMLVRPPIIATLRVRILRSERPADGSAQINVPARRTPRPASLLWPTDYRAAQQLTRRRHLLREHDGVMPLTADLSAVG